MSPELLLAGKEILMLSHISFRSVTSAASVLPDAR